MAGEKIISSVAGKKITANVGKYKIEIGNIHYNAPALNVEDEDRKIYGFKVSWKF